MDTIFALSSAPGRAGISVFRVSGSEALRAKTLIKLPVTLKPGKTHIVDIYSPKRQLIIDKAIVVYFKGPHSFTGEDIIEFHTHGSIAICNLLIEALLDIADFRLAEPGEFSKRAFINNKIDLTAAEGIADLINAETTQQVKQAMRQMTGELEHLYESWRLSLLKIQSLIEAYIDFPDEDIPNTVLDNINIVVENLKSTIITHLDDNGRGERLRSGIKLAIIGPPNAGKSTLLNYLAGRDVAIVSNQPGTTRDVLETHLDIGGYPLIVADTAGIRNTTDAVEIEGIRRAAVASNTADIKIFIFDATQNMATTEDFRQFINSTTIIIANKIDLINQLAPIAIDNHPVIAISIKNKLGLEQLQAAIVKQAERLAQPAETPAITRLRHRHSLNKTLNLLQDFNMTKDIVLAAEDIRLAARSLSQLTGKITVDEILGEVFANFCIGK